MKSRSVTEYIFYAGIALGVTVFMPEYFYDGFEIPKLFCVQVAVAILALVFFFTHILKRELILRLPTPAIPLILLFFIGFASITWSHSPSLAIERLYHVSALAIWLFFAWALFRDRSIREPLYFIAFAGIAIATWALMLDWVPFLRTWVYPNFVEVNATGTRAVDHYRSLTGNQGNPNFLLHALVLTAPMTLGAFLESIKTRKPLLPVCFGIGFLSQVTCFLTAQNRSGVLSFLVGMTLFLGVSRCYRGLGLRRYWRPALFAVFILAALFQPYLTHWKNRFSNLTDWNNIDVYSRVVFLETGAAMIADDPIRGKGIGQFVISYPKYKTAKHWELFSLLPPEIKMWESIPRQSHNEYLQVALELGLIGFTTFLAFWTLLGIRLWKCVRSSRGSPMFYLTLGATAGIAGSLVNALFTFPLQTVTSGALFWTTCGLLLVGCHEITLPKIRSKLPLVIVTLLLPIVCLWGSARVLRAQHLFFDALRQHARAPAYSAERSQFAANLLPGHFEFQYVAGWLSMLNHDADMAIRYYERSVEVSPYFPPPYNRLTDLYFARGDYAKAGEAMLRYKAKGPRINLNP